MQKVSIMIQSKVSVCAFTKSVLITCQVIQKYSIYMYTVYETTTRGKGQICLKLTALVIS